MSRDLERPTRLEERIWTNNVAHSDSNKDHGTGDDFLGGTADISRYEGQCETEDSVRCSGEICLSVLGPSRRRHTISNQLGGLVLTPGHHSEAGNRDQSDD